MLTRRVEQSSVPQPFFLPTAHPILTMARESTPQNFALRKQYAATKNVDTICKHLSYID